MGNERGVGREFNDKDEGNNDDKVDWKKEEDEKMKREDQEGKANMLLSG